MKSEAQNLISTRITEREIAPGFTSFSIKAGGEKIVTIEGSLLGGDYMSPKNNRAIAEIMAEMLDQGTKNIKKEELHDLMASLGISISFNTSRFLLHFSAHCLSEDLDKTLELMGDMLIYPSFSEGELGIIKKRLIGHEKELSTDTRTRALENFTRAIYESNHPNRYATSEEKIKMIEKVHRQDLVDFHKKLGFGKMNLVAAGDVSHEKLHRSLGKIFSDWKNSDFTIGTYPPGKTPAQKTYVARMPDKTSADVIIGAPISIGDADLRFYAFLLGNTVFGGTPTSRLFKNIREKKGLTYGTYSYVGGIGNNTPGYWYAWATFAPSLFGKGLSALREELKIFAQNGVTEKELKIKQETIVGNYKVGLSTTDGLARIILSNVEHGRSKEFVDEYPDIIKNLSLKEVNETVKELLSKSPLVTSAAGPISDTSLLA